MSLEEERKTIDAQLLYLTNTIEQMEALMPSASELNYLRKRKSADDNAAWAWQVIKTYAPWVATGIGLIGSGVYWLLTHAITITGPK